MGGEISIAELNTSQSSTGATSGNIMVKNYGTNPAVAFNFMLRVEGLFDVPCRAVRAFTKENEFEYIQEGGLNDYVHLRRKPISKPFTFQVERYACVDGLLFDPLALGTDLVLPIILLVNRYHWNAKYPYPTRTYTFTGCTVISKEYGELSAEKSGLLVETTTIAYREMVNVDVGLEANSMTPWSFNGTDKKGSGIRSARRIQDEKVAAYSENNKNGPRRWYIPGGDPKAKGYVTELVMPEADPSSPENSQPNGLLEKDGSAERIMSKKKEPRKWKFPEGGTASAVTREATKAASRKWEFPDGKTTSAATNEATKAKGRRWPEEQSAQKRQPTQQEKVAQANAIKKAAIEKKMRQKAAEDAAKVETAMRPEPRKWEFPDGKTTSAATNEATKAEPRKWEFPEGGTASAVTKEATKAASRKWPAVPSAQKVTDFLKK